MDPGTRISVCTRSEPARISRSCFHAVADELTASVAPAGWTDQVPAAVCAFYVLVPSRLAISVAQNSIGVLQHVSGEECNHACVRWDKFAPKQLAVASVCGLSIISSLLPPVRQVRTKGLEPRACTTTSLGSLVIRPAASISSSAFPNAAVLPRLPPGRTK